MVVYRYRIKKAPIRHEPGLSTGDPARARTWDPLIKSQITQLCKDMVHNEIYKAIDVLAT